MKDKLFRHHYRGHLNTSVSVDLEQIIEDTKQILQQYIKKETIMTACIYEYENMLFAYYESIGEKMKPEELFAPFSCCLLKWPGKDSMRDWVEMNHVFYHANPEGIKDWKREQKPELQRGRIAFLKPDKLFDYVYYHVAITKEGLLHGDKYQSIALHENILFSYFEEPKTEINIVRDLSRNSKVIEDWKQVIPEEHFIQGPQETNFTFMNSFITMGQ